jgi:hypothetical protein
LKTFSKTFQENFKNVSQKVVTKAVIKQASVAWLSHLHPYVICLIHEKCHDNFPESLRGGLFKVLVLKPLTL